MPTNEFTEHQFVLKSHKITLHVMSTLYVLYYFILVKTCMQQTEEKDTLNRGKRWKSIMVNLPTRGLTDEKVFRSAESLLAVCFSPCCCKFY